MQLPGLLIEYLINGSVALIWIMPLSTLLGISITLDSPSSILLLPGLYVVGMSVDYFARLVTLPWKRRMQRAMYKEFGVDKAKTSNDSIHTKILAYSPDLSAAVEMRSSMDRIARGTIINAFLSTIIFAIYQESLGARNLQVVLGVGILAISLSIAMWAQFQKLSYHYEMNALKAVEEKIATTIKNINSK